MKTRLLRLVASFVGFLFLVLIGAGQSALAAGPGVLHARQIVVTASVVGVDEAARTVTLQGAGGDVVLVTVGSAVKNFAQIKLGDTVKVAYLEAVAVQIMKPEEVSAPVTATAVHVAPLGQKPAMVRVRTEEDSVVIEAVDPANRLLTIRMPDGSKVVVDVDPSVQGFDTIKAGDHVVVRRTRAVAISVQE